MKKEKELGCINNQMYISHLKKRKKRSKNMITKNHASFLLEGAHENNNNNTNTNTCNPNTCNTNTCNTNTNT